MKIVILFDVVVVAAVRTAKVNQVGIKSNAAVHHHLVAPAVVDQAAAAFWASDKKMKEQFIAIIKGWPSNFKVYIEKQKREKKVWVFDAVHYFKMSSQIE